MILWMQFIHREKKNKGKPSNLRMGLRQNIISENGVCLSFIPNERKGDQEGRLLQKASYNSTMWVLKKFLFLHCNYSIKLTGKSKHVN